MQAPEGDGMQGAVALGHAVTRHPDEMYRGLRAVLKDEDPMAVIANGEAPHLLDTPLSRETALTARAVARAGIGETARQRITELQAEAIVNQGMPGGQEQTQAAEEGEPEPTIIEKWPNRNVQTKLLAARSFMNQIEESMIRKRDALFDTPGVPAQDKMDAIDLTKNAQEALDTLRQLVEAPGRMPHIEQALEEAGLWSDEVIFVADALKERYLSDVYTNEQGDEISAYMAYFALFMCEKDFVTIGEEPAGWDWRPSLHNNDDHRRVAQ
jgi:hypothetical protein